MIDPKKQPWAAGNLIIGRTVLERVEEEARSGYQRDEESCGFLVGPSENWRCIDGIVPMENRAGLLHRLDPEGYPRTARTYFDIDSLKFEKAIARCAVEGRPAKALYHSHLDAGAYFSETDASVAKMGQSEPPWGLAYLVTSVRGGRIDDRKLFVWDSLTRDFVESPLEVDEAR